MDSKKRYQKSVITLPFYLAQFREPLWVQKTTDLGRVRTSALRALDSCFPAIRLHDNTPNAKIPNAIISNAKITSDNMPNSKKNNHFDANFDKECSFYVQSLIVHIKRDGMTSTFTTLAQKNSEISTNEK